MLQSERIVEDCVSELKMITEIKNASHGLNKLHTAEKRISELEDI